MYEIKPVTKKADIQIVERLADEIWRQHYTPIIGKAQVDYMLDKFQSFQAISQQIEEGVTYYILVYDSIAAGYISFYPKEDILFLSKIYVKSNIRGKGLGKEAIQFVEQEALNFNLDGISLTVNKNNHRSIAAYEKMGFIKLKPVVMDIGEGFVMDDFVMEKRF